MSARDVIRTKLNSKGSSIRLAKCPKSKRGLSAKSCRMLASARKQNAGMRAGSLAWAEGRSGTWRKPQL